MSIIGFMKGAGAATTVIGALKQIKSRKIKLTENAQNGMTQLKFSDDSTLNLPSEIAELVVNKTIRDSLDAIINSPLEGESNAKLVFKDEKGQEVNNVTIEEATDFKTISQSIIEEVTEDTKRVEVYFTKVNFESTSGWQIRLPDDSLVSVTMKDAAFIERVLKKDEKFSKTALFSVNLRTIKTHRHGTSPTYKRELLKVVRQRGQ